MTKNVEHNIGKRVRIEHAGLHTYIHSLDFSYVLFLYHSFNFPMSYIIHSFIFPMSPRGCSAFPVEWGKSDGRIGHRVIRPWKKNLCT